MSGRARRSHKPKATPVPDKGRSEELSGECTSVSEDATSLSDSALGQPYELLANLGRCARSRNDITVKGEEQVASRAWPLIRSRIGRYQRGTHARARLGKPCLECRPRARALERLLTQAPASHTI
jgi:hypothetical protein